MTVATVLKARGMIRLVSASPTAAREGEGGPPNLLGWSWGSKRMLGCAVPPSCCSQFAAPRACAGWLAGSAGAAFLLQQGVLIKRHCCCATVSSCPCAAHATV